jgi:hypothetical protein
MTQTYVEARFGDRDLTEADLQHHEESIKLLRQMRSKKRAA